MSVKKKVENTKHDCGVSPKFLQLAQQLKNVLNFHKLIGIENYPKSKRELFKPVEKQQVGPVANKEPEQQKTETLSNITTHVKVCSACSLEKKRHDKILLDSLSPIRLMIVGDYCTAADRQKFIFGRKEDEMLFKMIEAIGLKKEEVFVTNCLKCSCESDNQPTKDLVLQCFPFLAREIAVVKPPVICAMGELAVQAILGEEQNLVRLRGRFHKYRYFDTLPVQVMPTFHPRFLLAHQEMKRATWQDLQLIQKRFLI